MPVLKWTDFYSVGVERIDKQHRRMLDMVNTAYDAVSAQRQQEVLDELVAELLVYARTHLATEEALMEEYGYPGAAAHKREHASLVDEALEAERALHQDGEMDADKLFKFLADWLRDHILGTDRKFGEFLKGKGLR